MLRLALAIYEYALTIEDERILVWSGRWTGSKILFLVNRLILLAIPFMTLTMYTSRVRPLFAFKGGCADHPLSRQTFQIPELAKF